MAIRPNNEERSFGADRERQREISNEGGRAARSTSGESASRGDASESGFARVGAIGASLRWIARKQREIASKGGRAAHQKGTAHEFDSSEARAAGRKGGVTVSRNREHMAAIGRRGGEARGANRAARLQAGRESSEQGANAQRFQSDREVGLSAGTNGQPATNTGSQGTARQSGNSLGGERRPGNDRRAQHRAPVGTTRPDRSILKRHAGASGVPFVVDANRGYATAAALGGDLVPDPLIDVASTHDGGHRPVPPASRQQRRDGDRARAFHARAVHPRQPEHRVGDLALRHRHDLVERESADQHPSSST